MNHELEFKIARSERMQEFYQTLYTIIAFAGGITALLSVCTMNYLFTQQFSLLAERAAWVAVITGVLTAFAMLTLMLLKVREFAQEMILKLEYRKVVRKAKLEFINYYNEDLVD